MLLLLGILLAFLDFIAFGEILYSIVGRVVLGLILVVAEAYVRTFIVLCAFVLLLEVYLGNLSRKGWLKYALVTMVICGVPPMTLSVYLNNYVLFTTFRGLEDLLSHLPVDRITMLGLFALLFLSLETLIVEFPRLLLAQRIWQKMKMERERGEKE